MTQWIINIVLLCALTVAGWFGWHHYQAQQNPQQHTQQTQQAFPVEISKAQQTTWHKQLQAIGTVYAIQSVDITPAAGGRVVDILFHSGEDVKKDQPLVQLESEALQAAVANSESALKLAGANLNRAQQLFKLNNYSKADLDLAQAQYDQAAGQLKQDKANLDQLLVRAPFAGKLGLRDVHLGQYVEPGDALTNLQTTNPMLVDFEVPEDAVRFIKPKQTIKVQATAYPDTAFEGAVIARDAQIDDESRKLTIRSQVLNPDGQLYPGMFVDVTVNADNTENVITIPLVAVNYSPLGNFVYVANQNQAEQRMITLGDQQGDMVAISKGLKANEQVVVAGQVRLQDKAPIKITGTFDLHDKATTGKADEVH